MAGGDGQGHLCHLTSQNGIGDDREGSTATARAGFRNLDNQRRRVRLQCKRTIIS
jgi:hypothetical protein